MKEFCAVPTCHNKLKSHEREVCDSCKKKFDPVQFRKDIQEYSKDYDYNLAKQQAPEPSSGAPTHTEEGPRAMAEHAMAVDRWLGHVVD